TQCRLIEVKTDIRFEFISLFREKTGTGGVVLPINVKENETKVLHALEALERHFKEKKLSLLTDCEIKTGVLVFFKKPNGGLERVLTAETVIDENVRTLVLTTAMAGG
ncbi:MAG: hypothetical protein AB1798_06605, partial [Spirochaetota bacterium]